jgi:hypothetical protein
MARTGGFSLLLANSSKSLTTAAATGIVSLSLRNLHHRRMQSQIVAICAEPRLRSKSMGRTDESKTCGLSGLVKPDAALQVLEARVAANRVKERMDFDPLQYAFLLLIRPLEPR